MAGRDAAIQSSKVRLTASSTDTISRNLSWDRIFEVSAIKENPKSRSATKDAIDESASFTSSISPFQPAASANRLNPRFIVHWRSLADIVDIPGAFWRGDGERDCCGDIIDVAVSRRPPRPAASDFKARRAGCKRLSKAGKAALAVARSEDHGEAENCPCRSVQGAHAFFDRYLVVIAEPFDAGVIAIISITASIFSRSRRLAIADES